MNVVRFVIFSVTLTAKMLSFAALNFFDDWTLKRMPVLFVGAALLSGAAYLAASSWDERLFALLWHAGPWMRSFIVAPVLAALVMLVLQKRATAAAT